ncbi:Mariner Mos1 transposase [Gryllus bimaculatus]|nr:Mariner Mos1 transposase [Gryllus bimaculatus]
MIARGLLWALLLQDNAPVHTAQATVDPCSHLRYEILPHPPDLAPGDFFRFRQLKESVRFASDDHVIAAVKNVLESETHNFYINGIRQVIHRHTQYIDEKNV